MNSIHIIEFEVVFVTMELQKRATLSVRLGVEALCRASKRCAQSLAMVVWFPKTGKLKHSDGSLA